MEICLTRPLPIDKPAGTPYVPSVPGNGFVIVNDQLYIAADVVDELEDAVRELMEWLQNPNASMDPSTVRIITEFQRARVERALLEAAQKRAKAVDALEEKLDTDELERAGDEEA